MANILQDLRLPKDSTMLTDITRAPMKEEQIRNHSESGGLSLKRIKPMTCQLVKSTTPLVL